jgi:MFS family permease
MLLAGSSLMAAWGTAGQYTMLSELGGPDGRLAVNSLASAQVSFATIVGPLLAGLLLGSVSPACSSPSMPLHSRSSASLPGAPARRRRPSGSRSMRWRRNRDSDSSGARIC